MLKETFVSILTTINPDITVAEGCWVKLHKAYTGEDRHYHNLDHLQKMLMVLSPARASVNDWESLVLAVIYHDAVYDVVEYVTTNDNEDKSAAMAEEALLAVGYPAEKIERIKNHILATKKHETSADDDTNYLSDADLYILGAPWAEYEAYMKAIRREYTVYPDTIYQAGRRKVLNGFLQAEPLYKTPHFQATYTAAAKENLARELEIISFY